ncbi:MAG: cyclic nucleotide-binding domain-containing protein [Desulfobacterales bacterium]|nr:cyclic nucleotide-binding domain-containing protein [Desulfobacterales bacterium]
MTGKVVFSGDLSFNNLAELFQILGGNNSTGVLRITSQYAPNPGLVYFVNGDPVNAVNGTLRGLDAVYPLFGWTEGKFEFVQENVQIEHAIKKSRMEISLDALRMLDDGVIKKVGALSLEEMAAAEKAEVGPGKKDAFPTLKGPAVDLIYVVEEEDFADGKKIVKEGSHGKWIWVILEGMVRVVRETPMGPLTVAQLGEGCFIGTFASFLFQEYARSATVTAVGDVRLGLLDTQLLSAEFRLLSPELRGLLIGMDGRLRKTTGRAVQLAQKEEEPTGLTKGTEVILNKGSAKEEAFTIVDGEAHVIGQSSKGPLYLLTLNKDDFFGNIPFLNTGQEPHQAAIMASKDIALNHLDVAGLREEHAQLPGILKSMIHNVSASLALTTKMAHRLHSEVPRASK